VDVQQDITMTKQAAHVFHVIIHVQNVQDLPIIVQYVQEPKEKAQLTDHVLAQFHITMTDKMLNVKNVLINVQFVMSWDVLNVPKIE
jgi:hypothetical protein